ncbi:hypothetical protein DPQ25_06910 [Hydrogeniiclostridium mannosilyticum]|uniref:WYL domain-containing protein n=1 Tax=Hydrogeniiclostridium mannosilyticum TaxID=2764322 RepID=A0A328UID4_9FIRM|nr:transcriptional regulator [Hydrogeniiclostridium mannosilyticum]RAQ29213.1 hypothetical protein DPQ25_06910 [Hydrogeniiclostridium mannosilyticum]
MGLKTSSKEKILELLKILWYYSDKEHPVSGEELCMLLQKQGVSSERKSIYRDISLLREAGFAVVKATGSQRGFYLETRMFDLAEIRILMDAILSTPSISAAKAQELVKKLGCQLSCYQARDIEEQLCKSGRGKSDNNELFHYIDLIHRAICQKKKIRFCYHHKLYDGKRAGLDTGRTFLLSPYALIWLNDKYYLAGNYEKYNNVSNYRVDRIRSVRIMDQDARDFSEVSPYKDFFDVEDYTRRSINMYNGTPLLVKLCCDKSLLEPLLDHFGGRMEFVCCRKNTFTVLVSVNSSEGLLEWLAQFGPRILVLSPLSLRKAILERSQRVKKAYDQGAPIAETYAQ